jgi:hypothetical protein
MFLIDFTSSFISFDAKIAVFLVTPSFIKQFLTASFDAAVAKDIDISSDKPLLIPSKYEFCYSFLPCFSHLT